MRGLAVVSSALAFAGCAQAPMPVAQAGATSGSDCFRAQQVSGYSSVSDEVVDVKVGANRFYRLQVSGYCPGAMFSQPVTLRTLGGGSWICRGLDAELISGGQSCMVRDVTPIPRATYEAGRTRR